MRSMKLRSRAGGSILAVDGLIKTLRSLFSAMDGTLSGIEGIS